MSYKNFHKFHIQFRLQDPQEASCKSTTLKSSKKATHLIGLPIQSHRLVYVHQFFCDTVLGSCFDERKCLGMTGSDVNTVDTNVIDVLIAIAHEYRVQLDIVSTILPHVVVSWKI